MIVHAHNKDKGRIMAEQVRLAWQSRHTIRYLVTADLRRTYRNKVLGYAWTLLDPLIMMVVYILFVVALFGRGGPQFPAILFSALLAWWWFTQTIGGAANSISGKSGLIQSIRFPIIVLPLSQIFVGFIEYLLSAVMLIPFLIAYHADWTPYMLWLPALILIQFTITTGLCLAVAAIGCYARDVANITKFIIRALFFLSPILYSAADRIPDRLYSIYMLNPFAALFESYKRILVLGQPPAQELLTALAIAMAVFLLGLWVFSRLEPRLAAVV